MYLNEKKHLSSESIFIWWTLKEINQNIRNVNLTPDERIVKVFFFFIESVWLHCRNDRFLSFGTNNEPFYKFFFWKHSFFRMHLRLFLFLAPDWLQDKKLVFWYQWDLALSTVDNYRIKQRNNFSNRLNTAIFFHIQ